MVHSAVTDCDAFVSVTSKAHLTLDRVWWFERSQPVNQIKTSSLLRMNILAQNSGCFSNHTLFFFLEVKSQPNYCTAARTKYTDSCGAFPAGTRLFISALCHKPLCSGPTVVLIYLLKDYVTSADLFLSFQLLSYQFPLDVQDSVPVYWAKLPYVFE